MRDPCGDGNAMYLHSVNIKIPAEILYYSFCKVLPLGETR